MIDYRLVEVREPFSQSAAIRIWLRWLVLHPTHKIKLKRHRVERWEKYYAV